MRVITGMHRSGTSLVARLFLAAGADMGNPSGFHPPDRWNPEGYFEQEEILSINMPLIHGPFWKLAYLRLPSEERILRRAAGMAARIKAVASRYRGRVVKETRFCLTLPAWLRHGAEIDAILVCLREPWAVASSLARRNRIPLSLGYRLWMEHNRRILPRAEEVPHGFILYSALMGGGSFDREAGRALDLLGVEVSPAGMAGLRERGVREGLDHSPPRPPGCPVEVDGLWRELLARHGAQAGRTAGGGNG